MKQLLIILSSLLLTCLGTYGQSIHFSQFNEIQSAFNPSATGLIPNGNYKIGLIYKNQWNSVPVRYNTFGINTEFSVYTKNAEGGWFGIGGYVLEDEGGDGNLKNNKFQGSLAYHAVLNEFNTLSLGFSGGIDNISLHPENLTYANQWDGSRYNIGITNGEKFTQNSFSYSYFNSGICFTTRNEDTRYIRLGYAIMNINKPSVSFNGNFAPIGFRHFVNAEFMFKTSDNLILLPVAYFNYQKGATEILIGAGVSYSMISSKSVKDGLKSALLSGIYYRFGDAFIPYVGYEQNEWKCTINYDFTASSLTSVNHSLGGLELSFFYIGSYNKVSKAMKVYACPRF